MKTFKEELGEKISKLKGDVINSDILDVAVEVHSKYKQCLTAMSNRIFEANMRVGWWSPEEVAESKFRPNGKYSKETATLIASKIALCHSELSEALEGMRKGLMDDHLPHRPMVEVELADTVIRICDLAGFLGLDLAGAVAEKLAYNAKRADHKLANRTAKGGKTI